MNQRVAEPEISVLSEPSSVEDYLKTLWERVRAAGEMIRELRGAKQILDGKVGELEREVMSLRTEIGRAHV